MKGDFSRWTFDRKKHYNAVLKQQGRVDLDADWNEQTAIDNYLARVTTRDVVGPCGVPRVLGLPDPDGFRVELAERPALNSVTFSSAQAGQILGESDLVLSTKDAGATWELRTLPNATGAAVPAVGPRDDAAVRTGLARGRALPGSATTRLTRAVDDAKGVNLVVPATGDSRWAVGDRGLILFHDGKQWQTQRSPVSTRLRAASFAESGLGVIVGDGGTVLVREKEGKKWTKAEVPTAENLHVVCFVGGDRSFCLAVGAGGTVLVSDDQAGKWTQIKSATTADLHAVCSAGGEESLCWVVGAGSTILKLVRNSSGWSAEVVLSSPSRPGLRAVHAADPLHACAVGEKGTVLAWQGKTWTPQVSGTDEDLNGVWFADKKNVWAVGAAGTVVRCADFGKLWERVEVFGPELVIAPGRIYVDGIPCECEESVLYVGQPDYTPEGFEVPPTAERPRTDLVYLDVWNRHVTALQDSGLREAALGGPDTATRVKTIWQAKIKTGVGQVQRDIDVRKLGELMSDLEELATSIGSGTAVSTKVDTLLHSIETNGRIVARVIDTGRKADEKLRRALLAPAVALKYRDKVSVTRVREIAELLSTHSLQIAEPEAEMTCCTRPPEWAPSTGTLCARTRPSEADKPCLMRPDAGYSLLENQLYRVEIHSGGESETRMFKWSRDNGSAAVSIDGIDGQAIQVRHTGRDGVLGFAAGQWVEVIGDLVELRSQAGTLAKVAEVDHAARTIKIDPTTTVPTLTDLGANPQLRRWDSVGAVTIPAPTATDGWIPLEGGIEVKFSAGTYRAGDYWLIPARTATGDIEWPKNGDTPTELPPLGIEHHYCPLALLEWKDSGVVVKDCRRFFYPLATPALHVAGTTWKNDDDVSISELDGGLRITLDGAPRPDTVSASSVIVRLEVPLRGEVQIPCVLYDLVVDGDAEVASEPNVIAWAPKSVEVWKAVTACTSKCRVRVALKGHLIWREDGGRRLYLDGQSFGTPGGKKAEKADEVAYRTDLVFPSGRGGQASDFESWFWLVAPQSTSRPRPITTTTSATPRPRTKPRTKKG